MYIIENIRAGKRTAVILNPNIFMKIAPLSVCFFQ